MARDHYSVVFIISLLHVITATSVYYVTPDDDQSRVNNDCPIDHECHTLQYYLHNNSKYFTSNTQLHFLQGNFYIIADIVIDSLHNFSLVGSGVNNTVIECSTPSLIAIINCSNTVIKNITIGSQCGSLMQPYFNIVKFIQVRNLFLFIHHTPPIKLHTSIFILNSYSTMLQSVLIKVHGIFIINGLGNTSVTDIVLYDSDLVILYSNYELKALQMNNKHTLQIVNFKYYDNKTTRKTVTVGKKLLYTIMIEFWQEDYSTEVFIKDSIFQFLKRIELITINFGRWPTGSFKNLATIKGCQFLSNSGEFQINSAMITVAYSAYINEEDQLNITNINEVQILDCNFTNNAAYHETAIIIKLYLLPSHYEMSYFTISNCAFIMNSNFVILNTTTNLLLDYTLIDNLPIIAKFMYQAIIKDLFCTVTITNSVFIQTGNGKDRNAIYGRNVVLNLNGPLVFTNFKSETDSIITVERVDVTIHGHVEFFNNNAVSLMSKIGLGSIQFKEDFLLNISNNKFSEEIFSIFYTIKLYDYTILQESYPMCFIQYISDSGNLDHQFAAEELINFSIIIHRTEARSLVNSHTTHCRWQPNSAFNTTSPLLVNQRFISDFDKWNDKLNDHRDTQKSLCSCSDGNNNINCSIDILGPIYPGQNAVFSLAVLNTLQNATDRDIVPISLETIDYSPLQCTIPTASMQHNVSRHRCSNVSYTLLSHSNNMCELLLKQDVNTVHGVRVSYGMFTVKLLPCPPGFMFIQMRCQCDPLLTLNEHIEDCDINDQTVLRSPNSWIFYSEPLHTYRLSKTCPFEYCYPQSTKLQLNNPDLQCQFSRSGILCGQCQLDLSTIFGSSDCQQCSNVYLLLIIPIAVSGILLVIVMFVLTLTVSEGTINPFILYVNILNIHNIPLFPSHSLVKPLHVFSSFANLNLGIESCFYNGMDDYTKTWLQFCFPVYLIMIITSIIIASRYSIVVKRLTLHKTIPVLATILLLSYTKILQTVSNVLFVYSAITDYPSNVSSVMWSIDANVPLFGLRHSVLFAFSLLISLLLILYTCLLLFGKFLRNFKAVTVYINPLLDAYNKAYKKNCCYWIGYELIIRCVLLATLLAVNNSTINLIIGNSFLSMVQFNYQHPYQNRMNSFSQMVLNLNLLILYSTLLMLREDQSTRVVVVNTMVGCAVVQFILMIIINRFSFKRCNVNVIKYVQQKLLSKKESGDFDMLLTRQGCDDAAND